MAQTGHDEDPDPTRRAVDMSRRGQNRSRESYLQLTNRRDDGAKGGQARTAADKRPSHAGGADERAARSR